MRLSQLAEGFDIRGPEDPEVTGLSEDSRRIGPGMLFVAIPGTAEDGHAYIADAIGRGACAVAAERTPAAPPPVPFVRVDSARRALAAMAARFFASPASSLDIVGFTGTFGKTSTSEILRALLSAGGFRPGVVGSLGSRYGGFHDPGQGLTTPAPVELQRALAGLRDAGADTAILEVTSHALRMDRIYGLSFSGGVIAAIMPGEHTDFHRTFEDYVEAKRRFLSHLRPGAVLAFDADNPPAAMLAAEATDMTRMGVSIEGRQAPLQLADIALDHTGARFTLHLRPGGGATADAPGGTGSGSGALNVNRSSTSPPTGARRETVIVEPGTLPMHSPLLGLGHLRNVALALAYAIAAGVAPGEAAAVLRTLAPLRRRMEQYSAGGRLVLDDTAAHPDSLRATFDVAHLLTAGPVAAGRHSRLAVVYAVRGRRGAEINQANAVALAELTDGGRGGTLIVTAAAETAGAADRATAGEIDATRSAFRECRCAMAWHDTLRGAVREAIDRTHAGDLIVLVGAQGMNEGKRLLFEES